MPWLVGIDEAGYGPNLGPLVMSAVACRVPADLAEASLWQVLRGAVRRARASDTQRLLIEDSKVVYSTARGLAELERGVLGSVFAGLLDRPCCVSQSMDLVCPHRHVELRTECWYTGSTPVPSSAEADDCRRAADRFRRACVSQGVTWGAVQSEVVCPGRFNEQLQRWQTKGTVLGEALVSLLRRGPVGDDDGDAVTVLVDKHGGRNTYAALLQHALPDAMVQTECEGCDRSAYRLLGLGREMRVVFQPRADGTHFNVALASMVSKYLRELLMSEFNAFWQNHVPGLRPTAGYPGDAARFFAEIQPALARLEIAESVIWRQR